MMLKMVIMSLIFCCLNITTMEDTQRIELIDVCSGENSVDLALAIENIKGQLNGADWEICCGRKKKEHKKLVEQLGLLRTQLIALENEKQNIDTLEKLEISVPHTILTFANKNLNSLHGFQGIVPFMLKNITKIDLSHNDLEVFPLPFFLESCPNLKALHAAHNKLIDVVYRSYRSPHDIATSTTLTTLDLSHNNLKKIDFAALYTALPYIENLDVSLNNELASYEYPPNIFWQQKTKDVWPCFNVQGASLNKEQMVNLRTLYRDNVIEVIKRRSGMYRMGIASGSMAAMGTFIVGMSIPGASLGLISSCAGIAGIWGLFLGDHFRRDYLFPRLIEQYLSEAIALSEKNVLCDEAVEKDTMQYIAQDAV
jgi:hypothetical protein